MKKVIWYTGTEKNTAVQAIESGRLLTPATLSSSPSRKKQKCMLPSVTERKTLTENSGKRNSDIY